MIRVFMIGFSNNKGGVESYISNLCSNLDTDKFEVIFSMPKIHINGKEWIRPINRHNYIMYYRFWRRFFKENQFDVMYYNTCDIVSLDIVRCAKKAGIPVRVIHSHSTYNQMQLRWFHRYTEKYNKNYVDSVATHLFACSQKAGGWMFPNKNFEVIKNGVDLSKYQFNEGYRKRLKSKLNIEDNILIGSVGRLDKEKNPLFSIEIMRVLVSKYYNVKFVFIGEGNLRTEIEEKIKEYQLENRVLLLGAREDANEWYSALDCLVMPSFFEGLPFTLVEAQAAGLPCVVSDKVSREANLTGLVEFLSLDEEKDVWVDKIIESVMAPRKDVTNQLIENGYSIKDTAKKVSGILLKALKDRGYKEFDN